MFCLGDQRRVSFSVQPGSVKVAGRGSRNAQRFSTLASGRRSGEVSRSMLPRAGDSKRPAVSLANRPAISLARKPHLWSLANLSCETIRIQNRLWKTLSATMPRGGCSPVPVLRRGGAAASPYQGDGIRERRAQKKGLPAPFWPCELRPAAPLGDLLRSLFQVRRDNVGPTENVVEDKVLLVRDERSFESVTAGRQDPSGSVTEQGALDRRDRKRRPEGGALPGFLGGKQIPTSGERGESVNSHQCLPDMRRSATESPLTRYATPRTSTPPRPALRVGTGSPRRHSEPVSRRGPHRSYSIPIFQPPPNPKRE